MVKHIQGLGVMAAASAVGFCGMLVFQSEAAAETIEDAMHSAVTTNPEVLELSSNRRAVNHEIRQSRSGYYPTLDFRAAVGEDYTDDPFTRSRAQTSGDDADTWQFRTESSLTLRQILFDGFETAGLVQREKARADSAAYRVEGAAETVALNAALAYLEVMRRGDLLRIAGDNVRAHEATLQDVQQLADAGRTDLGDVNQTESRLAAAREAVVRTQGELDDTIAAYIRVVGNPPSDMTQPTPPMDMFPGSQDEAVATAMDKNPDIYAGRADVRTAQAELRVANAAFWPDFNAEVTGAWDKNIDGVRGVERDLTAMLVMRYNVYSGGLDTSRKREAVERIAEAQHRTARLEREVAESTRTAWNALVTAGGRSDELRNQVSANERVVETYKEQFMAGRRFLLDLLDSQNELFLSQGDLSTQEYTASFGVYEVFGQMGTLLEAMNIAPPSEAMPIAAK